MSEREIEERYAMTLEEAEKYCANLPEEVKTLVKFGHLVVRIPIKFNKKSEEKEGEKMTGKDSITEPTTGWTHYEPAVDCPYRDECSSHPTWCGSCKKNKARGKRNYYEPDSYPWPWYGDPYPWQDHTTIS